MKMLMRSGIICLLLSLILTSSANTDELTPVLFRKSNGGRNTSANFSLLLSKSRYGFSSHMLFNISPETDGRYTYALIDTDDDAIVQAGEDTYRMGDSVIDIINNDLHVDIPADGETINYKLSARYVPDNRRWKTATFTEYFTVSRYDGKIYFGD